MTAEFPNETLWVDSPYGGSIMKFFLAALEPSGPRYGPPKFSTVYVIDLKYIEKCDPVAQWKRVTFSFFLSPVRIPTAHTFLFLLKSNFILFYIFILKNPAFSFHKNDSQQNSDLYIEQIILD